MNATDPVDQAEIAKSKAISHDIAVDEKHDIVVEAAPPYEDHADDLKMIPTDEELATLRRVSGSLPWTTFTVAFVELCERFSYYGTTAVCKFQRAGSIELTRADIQISVVNFIQRPLPDGSTTGALLTDFSNGVPGALGMGQRASTGLTLCKWRNLKFRKCLDDTDFKNL